MVQAAESSAVIFANLTRRCREASTTYISRSTADVARLSYARRRICGNANSTYPPSHRCCSLGSMSLSGIWYVNAACDAMFDLFPSKEPGCRVTTTDVLRRVHAIRDRGSMTGGEIAAVLLRCAPGRGLAAVCLFELHLLEQHIGQQPPQARVLKLKLGNSIGLRLV